MLQTAKDSDVAERTEEQPGPGVVVVFSGSRPTLVAHLIDGDGLPIDPRLRGVAGDDRMSQAHARVRLLDGAFGVSDLGSRNGTFVEGQRIADEQWVHPPAVVRAGRTVMMLSRDVRRFEGARVEVSADAVIGPTLAAALTQVERAARAGGALSITGETGTGKEHAARRFHAATGATGPMVAVNCAAIPAGIAERLLFGARRGAYSDADQHVDGYLAAADGGTIFLDELGELDLAVQGKLLRVLETRELMPLGATRARRLDLRVVVATSRDLRLEVVAKRFREDLYYRIGRPEVTLPPLRERLEDVPWLVALALTRAVPGATPHPTLIEACLLRRWPGNLRELIGELGRAAFAARDAGRSEVRVADLSPTAGQVIERATTPTPAPRVGLSRDAVSAAMVVTEGNVARAARTLGVHRNQLRRFLVQHPDLVSRKPDA